ncbi:MarR family winged helix-turn-helix transcriptional regulator [Streptomyces sp. NPDC051018]|uniref:MarR family winged helix-turn-helix transcriptional regulator n=1 Tax=Streptomyces sp. NPDC051018 TaxID=3365639 RepID=UPI0037AA5DC4
MPNNGPNNGLAGGLGIGLAEELGELLVGVNRLARRKLRGGLAGPPLPVAQAELLRLVQSYPGIRVSAAARELRLAGNSVSTLVRRLGDLGLLAREPDPLDRRAARLRVTPEAARRLRDWDDRRAALYREQWQRLAPGDRTALAAALPALHRLAAQLGGETLSDTGK